MNELENSILERILKDVKYYDKDFSLEKLSHKEGQKCVYEFLDLIVTNAGCYDYMFVIAITKFEEKHGKFILPYLFEILDNYCNFPDYFNKSIAFAAFYNIGLHYARYFQTNELLQLLKNATYISLFKDDYPLCYGVMSRYFSIKGMYDRMFLLNQGSIRRLEKLLNTRPELFTKTPYGYQQTGNSVSLKVGCVAAAVKMFEQKFIRGQLDDDYKNSSSVNPKMDIENLTNEQLQNMIIEEDYEIDDYLISEETLATAKIYVDEAMAYNPKYPKYPYLKAQTIFYEAIFKKERIDFDKLVLIKDLLNKAKSLENPKANDYQLRVGQCDKFLNQVETYMEKGSVGGDKKLNLQYFKMKDEIINMQECPPPQKRIKPNAKGNDAYAFISYSTRDFRSVYCDLIAYKNRGLNFWYDAEVIPGEKWQKTIENKIKNATCIICYLSENFLKSGAILNELQLFKKYDKPVIWIDLTGQKQISKIIVDIIRNSPKDSLGSLNSSMLNIITELIDDDIDLITRDRDYQSELHINRIQDVVKQKFVDILQNINSEALTLKNTKPDLNGNPTLPNEDYYINDSQNNIYIVMDGITRNKKEYKGNGSIAYDVSKLFAETIHDYIATNLPNCNDFKTAKLMLEEGFIIANRAVDELLIQREKEFIGYEKPGAVGIVSFILNKKLVYAAVGDCMGILVRDKQKLVFSLEQTSFPFTYLDPNNDREYIVANFVNNPDNDYGYGVVNGEEGAKHYFNVSYINLENGDKIYLVSDGISDLIQYAKVENFVNCSLEELMDKSTKQDTLMNKPYNDDKTIIVINISI